MRQNTRRSRCARAILLDLSLAIDRKEAHAERNAPRDIALLLDGMP